MRYKTSGTCSSAIDFEVEDGVVKEVKFIGGCNGNTQGVAALVKGMPVDEVVSRLEGIKCGFKGLDASTPRLVSPKRLGRPCWSPRF